MQTDHRVSARRQDLLIIKKNRILLFQQRRRENERKLKDRQMLGSFQRAEKAVEHEVDIALVVNALETAPKSLKR